MGMVEYGFDFLGYNRRIIEDFMRLRTALIIPPMISPNQSDLFQIWYKKGRIRANPAFLHAGDYN